MTDFIDFFSTYLFGFSFFVFLSSFCLLSVFFLSSLRFLLYLSTLLLLLLLSFSFFFFPLPRSQFDFSSRRRRRRRLKLNKMQKKFKESQSQTWMILWSFCLPSTSNKLELETRFRGFSEIFQSMINLDSPFSRAHLIKKIEFWIIFVGKALKLVSNWICSTVLPLDGLDQHFRVTVHFPLTSTVDYPQQHKKISSEKKLGIMGIHPGAAGWEASMLPLSLTAPHFQNSLLSTRWVR